MKFPVTKKDGEDYTAEELLEELSQEDGGYFLLGKNSFWHGGVHFTHAKFDHARKEQPLRAIADGVVIAYRLNKNYLKIPNLPGIGGPFFFASGMCIAEHIWTSPKKGPTAEEKEQQWAGREIKLKEARNARNIKSTKISADQQYQILLPQDTILKIVSVEDGFFQVRPLAEVKAAGKRCALDPKTKQPVVRDEKEITVTAADRLWIVASDDKAGSLFEEHDRPEKWQNRLIELKADTTVHQDGTGERPLGTLPAGTKLKLAGTTAPTSPALAQATTQHAANLTAPDGGVRVLEAGKPVWIDCFDEAGAVKQRNGSPVVDDTPTARPEQTSFKYYSLYMHLRSYEEYIPEEPVAEKIETVTVNAIDLSVRDKHRSDASAKKIGFISDKAVLEVLQTRTHGKYTDIEGRIVSGRVLDQPSTSKTTAKEVKKAGDIVWVPTQADTKSFADAGELITIKAEGQAVREAAEGQTIGVLTQGALLKVEALQDKADDPKSAQVRATLVRGRVLSSLLPPQTIVKEPGDEVWFDVSQNMKATLEAPLDKDKEAKDPVWPMYWKGTVTAHPKKAEGLVVWKNCDSTKTKPAEILTNKIGTLASKAANRFDYKTDDLKTVEIDGKTRRFASCTAKTPDYKSLEANQKAETAFWIELDPDTLVIDHIDTSAFNTVENVRVPIKAGEPVGFLGLWETPKGYTGKKMEAWQAHVEVFTPDRKAVDDLLNNPCQLTEGRQYLRLPRGTLLYHPPAEEGTAQAQAAQAAIEAALQAVQTGTLTAPLSLPPAPQPFWSLRRNHALALDNLKPYKDFEGRQWYRVQAEGKQGAVPEDATEIVSQFDWGKLGFALLEEENAKDGFLDEDNLSAFYRAMHDRLEPDEPEITPTSIIRAQHARENRDPYTKLIAAHRTEWAMNNDYIRRMQKIVVPEKGSPEDKRPGTNYFTQELARLQKVCFWDRLDPKLPEKLYFFHPVRAVEFLLGGADLKCKECGATITLTDEFLKKVMPKAKQEFIDELILCSTELFQKYGVDTCRQIKHLLAQAKKETMEFTAFKENLRYVTGGAARVYVLSPTVINNGFARKGMTFTSHQAKLNWIQANLINNDAAYGEHCYGTSEQPGKDFRGRGLIHLTHYGTYQKCARETGHPIDSQPELVESNLRIIIETGLWFWKDKNLAVIANKPENGGDEGVRKITHMVTGAAAGLAERQSYKRQITPIFDQDFSSGCLG